MGGGLFIATLILMVFGIVLIFFPGRIGVIIYSAVGAFLFSVSLSQLNFAHQKLTPPMFYSIFCRKILYFKTNHKQQILEPVNLGSLAILRE